MYRTPAELGTNFVALYGQQKYSADWFVQCGMCFFHLLVGYSPNLDVKNPQVIRRVEELRWLAKYGFADRVAEIILSQDVSIHLFRSLLNLISKKGSTQARHALSCCPHLYQIQPDYTSGILIIRNNSESGRCRTRPTIFVFDGTQIWKVGSSALDHNNSFVGQKRRERRR